MSLRALFGLLGIASAALGLPPAPAGVTGALHPLAAPVAPSAQPLHASAGGPPGTALSRWRYSGLDALVRASYYAAYRRDPKPQEIFNVSPGLPESDVEGPVVIDDAGVIYGRSAQTNSYWVVADICFRSPTGCEDMGAFQVFHRTGPNGDFAYGNFDICSIPPPLAGLWFPGGRGPMGTHCPQRQGTSGTVPVAAALSAATPGMSHDIVPIGGGRYEAAVFDKAAHIDFWEFAGTKWDEVGRSTYPTLPGQPASVRVVGRQLKGMADATFIATGVFTGDSSGQALAFGNGPRGWGTIAWEPGNVLVPTGHRATDNTTPGIYFNEQFSDGQLETTSLNPYFSTATGAEFPLDTYWSWDASSAHFVDARDNSFTSSLPTWGKSLSRSGPTLTRCSKTPLTGTYEALVQVGAPTWSARFGERLPVAVHAVEPQGVGKAICVSQLLPGTMPIVVDGATAGDKSYVLITAPAWVLNVLVISAGPGPGPLTVQSAPVGTTPWVVPASLHIATIVSDLGTSAQNAVGGNPESPVDAICTFAHGVITGFVVNGTV
jgi:hypothetical protein